MFFVKHGKGLSSLGWRQTTISVPTRNPSGIPKTYDIYWKHSYGCYPKPVYRHQPLGPDAAIRPGGGLRQPLAWRPRLYIIDVCL